MTISAHRIYHSKILTSKLYYPLQTTRFLQTSYKMSGRKSILTVGLKQAPKTATEEEKQSAGDSEQLRQTIMAEMKKVKEAGFDIDVLFVEPEDSAALKELRDKLSSKKWDGFIVGFGVRGHPEYTTFFEKAVNSGIELSPGTKMGFNTRPDDLYECIQRNF